MKFKVTKNLIEKAMTRIEAIVPARDMQTLLSNVLLTIEKDKVSITASDMESTVRVYIDAEGSDSGELIVRAKKLSEIAKQLSSDDFIFNAQKSEIEEPIEDEEEIAYQIQIEGSSQKAAKFRMTGSDRSHFPDINIIDEKKLSSVPTEVLSEMIEKTIYSISHEDNRYIYNGLFISSEGSKLTVVGTDGRRLAAVSRSIPNPVQLGSNEEEKDIVIHAKAIRELQRIIEGSSEIFLGVEKRDIFFRTPEAELSSRLLEGKFPDYRRVIPGEATITFSMEKNAFADALKQVMVMTEQPSHQIRLSVKKGSLDIMANTPDLGEAEIRLPIDYNGEDLDIGFNALYIVDIIKSLDCEKIQIELNDASKPIVIKDPDDPEFIALVMPMKI
ncbi:MAG: DNA polymerase III subunit beta [Spirochaetia bacterium]|nr:DNA polymerase III subunit beta [Spirochaetia bacterium]